MNEPKISVLIPMYNRKQYIKDCINSVLNQTFQDFEIIIRDDGSTDGVFELVQKIYADKISSGKIKLFRNEKNLGEGANTNLLIREAKGKYFTFLHNDDIYLPHALEHLYKVAESTGADVVHSSFFYIMHGNNFDSKSLSVICDSHPVEKITIMPDDPVKRFDEWQSGGTFHDIQYNIYNRKFILDNEIFHEEFEAESLFFTLWWIMLAKVFVKTPVIFYLRRSNPDSQTGNKIFSPAQVNHFISSKIELSRQMDKLFNKVELFRDNEYLQYEIKSRIFIIRDMFFLKKLKTYGNGITPELYDAVADAFKKYFGDDYFYPAMLFHWVHVIMFNKAPNKITAPPPRVCNSRIMFDAA